MAMPIVKEVKDCEVGLYTIGHKPLGCNFNLGDYKAFGKDDAAATRVPGTNPIDEFCGLSRFDCEIFFWVDCTPLDRWHDPTDLHIGEHVNHILAIVDSASFQEVMTRIKMGWKLFLRTRTSGYSYDGVIFDPYGQCRSVALARIIHHCMKQQGATAHAVMHLSKE
jgi:hypothetical protein